jgi:hypothetical protein
MDFLLIVQLMDIGLTSLIVFGNTLGICVIAKCYGEFVHEKALAFVAE